MLTGAVRANGPRLAWRAAAGFAVVVLGLAAALLLLRVAHDGRVYPAVVVADVEVGGLTPAEAEAAIRQRAGALESQAVVFSSGDRHWETTLRDIGAGADVDGALDAAFAVGREPAARDRLAVALDLAQGDEQIPLRFRFDQTRLDAWFDAIDRDLGQRPANAALAIDGPTVSIVPERDGTVVDRALASDAILASLRELRPLAATLPTTAQVADVRAADLQPALEQMRLAMAMPVQVAHAGGLWTLPPADLGRFVTQTVDPTRRGAEAFALGMDRQALAGWLEERLAAAIEREPKDAEVGWNGERLVSVVSSVDGVELRPDDLAVAVEQSFFGAHGVVAAPVTIEKPTIDSNNLAALGITRLLGTGSSNYSGSSDGRATNVEVGAALLNGTLVPPRSEFSFNHSIGYITEDKGFVEAQVILGEQIGQDIGGGICQVSTTAFRAAYFAGMPITEWWPHRFRIAFYEYDDWAPGLDASILQPTPDPSTWGDFRFDNPTDSWLLVESWTDGVNVVVNVYGEDTGWVVEDTGPTFGKKFQMERDEELVDPELDPGVINQVSIASVGEEVTHFRRVTDRAGNLLWERSFYTKFYPRGNVWQVSPDMKGKSPANPDREPPPLPPEDGSQTADGNSAAGDQPVWEEPSGDEAATAE
jgi:vancomycin resistance protein YoaR